MTQTQENRMFTNEDFDTHTLALALEANRATQAELKEAATDIEATLFARMQEAGGIALPDEEFKIALESSTPSYDYDVLRPLLETVPADDLAKAYTPKHMVTPPQPEPYEAPEKWNGSALNKLERDYGGETGKVIAAARIAGPKRLVVERRNGGK